MPTTFLYRLNWRRQARLHLLKNNSVSIVPDIMLWNTLHGFHIAIRRKTFHWLVAVISGQSVVQLAFPQSLNAHTCPAGRQLGLGAMDVCVNFCLADSIKASTARDSPVPQGHHPARRNQGYHLPGPQTRALLPPVHPEVSLNWADQPIHDEGPKFVTWSVLHSCNCTTLSPPRITFRGSCWRNEVKKEERIFPFTSPSWGKRNIFIIRSHTWCFKCSKILT